jgi:fructose-specific phosphotransferase system IIC component
MMSDRRTRREAGFLVYGVILGALLGLVINLWTEYYMKWLDSLVPPELWPLILALTTILLFVILGYLTVWSAKQITSSE